MPLLVVAVLGAAAGVAVLLAAGRRPVVDPFRAPACAWCPGNRGLEYAPPPGPPVRAVAAGVVTFTGVVAGTRYVVVDHARRLARRPTAGWRRAVSCGAGDVGRRRQ